MKVGQNVASCVQEVISVNLQAAVRRSGLGEGHGARGSPFLSAIDYPMSSSRLRLCLAKVIMRFCYQHSCGQNGQPTAEGNIEEAVGDGSGEICAGGGPMGFLFVASV